MTHNDCPWPYNLQITPKTLSELKYTVKVTAIIAQRNERTEVSIVDSSYQQGIWSVNVTFGIFPILSKRNLVAGVKTI